MFYIKHPVPIAPGAEAELRVELTGDNVFTRCAGCGCELPVNLLDWAETVPEFDYDLSIYCAECTDQRWGLGVSARRGPGGDRR